jgi:hypothetical protein
MQNYRANQQSGNSVSFELEAAKLRYNFLFRKLISLSMFPTD